ncbi:MAG: TraR/DksA C4-type zinc finger protein [Candidatus Omnitrophota bacterium]
MDRAKKEKIKKVLIAKREELLNKIKHIEQDNLGTSQRDSTGDLSGYSFHMADVASDSFEREVSLGLAASEVKLLNEIEDAIKRIKDKDFGKCEECGKNIPFTRISAVPYAKLCISCQEEEDKSAK